MKLDLSTNKNLKLKFGARVASLREGLGLTREELAEKADISPQNLAKIENGQRFFSSESLGRLASALHVNVADLFVVEGSRSKDSSPAWSKLEILLRHRSESEIAFAHSLLAMIFKKIPTEQD